MFTFDQEIETLAGQAQAQKKHDSRIWRRLDALRSVPQENRAHVEKCVNEYSNSASRFLSGHERVYLEDQIHFHKLDWLING